jgi:hypothetical protein
VVGQVVFPGLAVKQLFWMVLMRCHSTTDSRSWALAAEILVSLGYEVMHKAASFSCDGRRFCVFDRIGAQQYRLGPQEEGSFSKEGLDVVLGGMFRSN